MRRLSAACSVDRARDDVSSFAGRTSTSGSRGRDQGRRGGRDGCYQTDEHSRNWEHQRPDSSDDLHLDTSPALGRLDIRHGFKLGILSLNQTEVALKRRRPSTIRGGQVHSAGRIRAGSVPGGRKGRMPSVPSDETHASSDGIHSNRDHNRRVMTTTTRQRTRGPAPMIRSRASDLVLRGGRCWVRTSDPCRVKAVLSH